MQTEEFQKLLNKIDFFKVFYTKPNIGIFLIICILIGSADIASSANLKAGIVAYKKGNYSAALKEWKPLALNGYAPAQVNLGKLYADGKGVIQSDSKAAIWFRRAAEQGFPPGLGNLALMYVLGRGVEQNNLRAFMWASLGALRHSENSRKIKNFLARKISPSQLSLIQKEIDACENRKYKGC